MTPTWAVSGVFTNSIKGPRATKPSMLAQVTFKKLHFIPISYTSIVRKFNKVIFLCCEQFNERSDYVTPEDEGESESRRVEYGAVGAQSNQTMLTRPQSHSNTQFFSPQNYSKLLSIDCPKIL